MKVLHLYATLPLVTVTAFAVPGNQELGDTLALDGSWQCLPLPVPLSKILYGALQITGKHAILQPFFYSSSKEMTFLGVTLNLMAFFRVTLNVMTDIIVGETGRSKNKTGRMKTSVKTRLEMGFIIPQARQSH